jgi:hypothetical protein
MAEKGCQAWGHPDSPTPARAGGHHACNGEFGSKVELKCGEATAVVQLIEDYDQTALAFWALPAEVLRVRAEGTAAAEAMSRRHLLHPAVGYQSVAVVRRPTFEGSAAQARIRDIEQQRESEEGSDSDSSSDDDGDNERLIVSNASRSDATEEQHRNAPKRKRAGVVAETTEDIEEKGMDVNAVFGMGLKGREVWFGVSVPCKARAKVRLQFLEPVEGEAGMFVLSSQCETYQNNMIEHTFTNTIFVITTTYKLTKKTQCRQKSSKEVKTLTKTPLDADTLAKLSEKCAQEGDELE